MLSDIESSARHECLYDYDRLKDNNEWSNYVLIKLNKLVNEDANPLYINTYIKSAQTMYINYINLLEVKKNVKTNR